MDDDDDGLLKFLSENGLTNIKWLKHFKDKGITKVNQIRELEYKDDCYQSLSLDAAPNEKIALRKIFQIKAPVDPEEGLDSDLNKVGLDAIRWSDIFKNQLGIKSPQALQHVGSESYQLLAQFAEEPWEKKALRKLLGMESSFQMQRKKQRTKLEKRQDECAQLLKDLKEEGKDRQDMLAQNIEGKFCERLHIPEKVWLKEAETPNQAITQMEAMLGNTRRTLKSTDDVSGLSVIERASGGLALRGVLITTDPNDATELRKTLLRAPKDVHLDSPFHSQHERTHQFSSKRKENQFFKRVEGLGYSTSTSAKAGLWEVTFEASAGHSHSKEESTEEHRYEKSYCSVVKYSVMPMASCSFKYHQLQLSEAALIQLQKINNILLNDATKPIQKECEAFFQRFGSHACIGPLHFGGRYTWKSYSTGFKESDKSTIQELQSEAITVQVGMSYGGVAGASVSTSVSSMNCKFKGKYSMALTSQTFIEVNVTGGPPEVTGLPDWKNGLVACNKTWQLIDRGTHGVPVWEIIEMNHSSSFQNYSHFVQKLKHAWQALNKTDELILDTEVQNTVKSWNENLHPPKFKNQLSWLVTKKEEISKESLNPQVWATKYLSQPPLQKFLHSVAMFSRQGTSENSDTLKRHLRRLVEPIDLCTTRVFPNQQFILKWLYGTEESTPPMEYQDFLSLKNYFKLALECIRGWMLPHGKQMMEIAVSLDCSIKATAIVAKATSCFRRYLQETGQKYEDLFTTTMLYPFKYDPLKCHFSALISINDLKYLCERFGGDADKFCCVKMKNLILRLQSYLFSLTVDLYDYFDVTEEQVMSHTKYLEGEIGGEMEPELKGILTKLKLYDSEHDWEMFKNQLDSLIEDISLKSGTGHSLEDVLGQDKVNVSLKKEEPQTSLDNEDEVKKLFVRLHLTDHFPQKLSLSHALMIQENTCEADTKDKGANTQFVILQKIMGFDHRCRMTLALDSKVEQKSSNESESDSSDEDDDKTEAMIHPMDGLLALLHCSDNFLRKDLMSRLATCQLAVPLLLPDPITHKPTFLLWGMRSIFKEFQSFDGTVLYAGPIIRYAAPIASFLRFGKHSVSKSKLLNAVLSTSNHATFYHYDCAGGRARKMLVNGLVEVSWYLPSKNDESLPKAITFTNLRGNASEYPEQVQFLSKVSFIHFVLLNEGDLNDYTVSILKRLSEAPGGIVVLQTQSSSGLKQKLKQSISEENFSIIKLSAKNEYDMRVSIHKKIKRKLSTEVTLTLEKCKEAAYNCCIKVDEDEPNCTKGREVADVFLECLNEFQKSNPGSSPKELLVLQGKDLWHKYGEVEKEKYRQTLKGHKPTYEYSGMQQDKLKHIRKRQYTQSKNLSPLMSSFLTSLLSIKGEIAWYYLHWLKIYLDDLSRELLPPLHRDYQKKRMELNAIQKQEKKDEIAEEKCRTEMNQLNMRLIDASFGPEHLFREIGQLYEAVMSQTNATKNLQRKISRLPEIAAQLLYDGFPLELMDGDCAHVPLKWVTSVLEKVSELLEKKKVGTSTPQVFVLSVLGLQSTGKSTMLNTIFGVQFSVSAGRCTRGAFMQLLPVHESLQKRCGFQYFLLIDTEGLRAPELDALKMQKHDNELATFVIGLANLTIINIKGEISGDMNDVLQTAVHAFLRMSQVKLRPSCHFAYQNVPAVTAGDKAMQGRLKVKDTLDAMTKEAAEQTGLKGSFCYFSDVITFDYEKDVSFFPDLWTGSPPMAHVSEFYSVEAQTLKHCLIKRVEQSQKSRDDSVLRLKEHLGELWKAILQEDFVFSFKNTYEVAAYTKLEEEYGEWSHFFKKEMEEWEQKAQNVLMSCVPEKLEDEYQRKIDELPKHVQTVYDKLEGKMNTHFEESKEQETIVKWKDHIADDLKLLRKKLKRHAFNTCDQLFNARRSRARADSKIENLSSEIIEHVRQVASKLERGRLSDEQLKERFEESWVGWIKELTPNIDQIKPPDIKSEVENSVREYKTLITYHKLLVQKLTEPVGKTGKPNQWGADLQLKVKPNHLKLMKQPMWSLSGFVKGAVDAVAGSHLSVHPFIGPAQEKTRIVFTEVKKWLTKKRDSGEDFKPNFTKELLDLLFLNIAKNPSDKYDFQPEYSVEMALTACGYAQKTFEEMSEAFCKKHDPLVYIETELKHECWKQFKDNYNDIEKEKSAAETLCSQLKNPIRMQVLFDLERVISDGMQAEYKWLKSKKRLRAKVLHDIGDKLEEDRKRGRSCDFSDCALYLKKPAQSLEMWIKKYTDDYCNDCTGGPTRISKIATEKLQVMVELVKGSAQDVSDTVTKSLPTQKHCYITGWLNEFHKILKEKITLDMTKLRNMFGQDVILKSIPFFQEEVVKGLHDLHMQLKWEFQRMSASVWTDHKLAKKPYDTLFEEIIGCIEQCPFCMQQCDYTKPNHQNHYPNPVLHSAKHRPKCLGGYSLVRDNTMSLDVCTFAVDSKCTFRNQDTNQESHPYSEYKKFYPDWDIPRERSLPPSDFWIWLVGNFSEEIEVCFGHSETEIYDDWKRRNWSDVKPGLMEEYQEN